MVTPNSELKVDLDGISVDEFHQSADKHHLFNQLADHHLLPGRRQHQPATAAAPGGFFSLIVNVVLCSLGLVGIFQESPLKFWTFFVVCFEYARSYLRQDDFFYKNKG
jgi:hypothetical protein